MYDSCKISYTLWFQADCIDMYIKIIINVTINIIAIICINDNILAAVKTLSTFNHLRIKAFITFVFSFNAKC